MRLAACRARTLGGRPFGAKRTESIDLPEGVGGRRVMYRRFRCVVSLSAPTGWPGHTHRCARVSATWSAITRELGICVCNTTNTHPQSISHNSNSRRASRMMSTDRRCRHQRRYASAPQPNTSASRCGSSAQCVQCGPLKSPAAERARCSSGGWEILMSGSRHSAIRRRAPQMPLFRVNAVQCRVGCANCAVPPKGSPTVVR
jgi:hypothetical protein